MKILLITLLIAANANAGILLEPFIGMNVGTKDTIKIKTGPTAGREYKDTDANGDLFIGGRVGLTSYGFFGAVDYRKLMSGEGDSDASSLGLTAGYDFPILVRGWVSYLLTNDLTTTDNTDVDGDGGLRFGVGFTAMPFLSFNIEYESSDYSNTSLDTKRETLLLSLSLPIDL